MSDEQRAGYEETLTQELKSALYAAGVWEPETQRRAAQVILGAVRRSAWLQAQQLDSQVPLREKIRSYQSQLGSAIADKDRAEVQAARVRDLALVELFEFCAPEQWPAELRKVYEMHVASGYWAELQGRRGIAGG